MATNTNCRVDLTWPQKEDEKHSNKKSVKSRRKKKGNRERKEDVEDKNYEEGPRDDVSEESVFVKEATGAKRSVSVATSDTPPHVPTITAYELNQQKSQALEFSLFDINALMKVLVEIALVELRNQSILDQTALGTSIAGQTSELYLAIMLPLLYAWGSGLDYKVQERVNRDLSLAKIFSHTHKERFALSDIQISKPSVEHLWREMLANGAALDESSLQSLATIDEDRKKFGLSPYYDYCASLSSENHRVYQFVEALAYLHPPELALGKEFL